VVNWDQRGSGKSAARTVTLERLLVDLYELVALLKQREPARHLYLMGHSWGSLLALLALRRQPQLCDGFISVGQLVAGVENELLSHQLAIEAARIKGYGILRRALLAELPPYGDRADALLRKCLYLYVLGGFFRRRDTFGLLSTLVASKEYTVTEKLAYMTRFRSSLKQLQPTIETIDLLAIPLELEVPVLFCVGRHDLVTPPALAKKLFEHLKSPDKRFEVFDNEAHCLHYQDPAGFAQCVQTWLATMQDGMDVTQIQAQS
jgi:pimeloyl-ACP methyl ester carboxylesterase